MLHLPPLAAGEGEERRKDRQEDGRVWRGKKVGAGRGGVRGRDGSGRREREWLRTEERNERKKGPEEIEWRRKIL